MDAMNDIQKIRTQIEQHQAEQEQVLRRTMSVPEMRKLLGLKKTESYWLVHRKFFRTETIGGMMRIDLESFEKWYANQVKYGRQADETLRGKAGNHIKAVLQTAPDGTVAGRYQVWTGYPPERRNAG